MIVAPSNVIDTWQDYLFNYFKEDQAPKVLVVQGIDDLRCIGPDDYDYILLSQERLTANYTEALEGVGYDMLILDEMHKLKNLSSGKRAENILRLAEQINGSEDKI